MSSSKRYRNRFDPGRALVKILRHTAAQRNIPMDSGGWVSLDYLLKLTEFSGVTTEDVQKIVKESDKQRMKLERRPNGWFIRANQGHSLQTVNDTELLTAITSETAHTYNTVIHGTYHHAWKSIKESGLNKMNRKHVHFAIGLPGDRGVISGMRRSSEILIYVDLKKAITDGIPFFISANSVILCPGLGDSGTLPAKYFTKVIDVRTGKDLLCGH